MPIKTDPFETDSDKPENKSTPVARKTAPTEATKSEAPARVEEEEKVPQSYVWLANGDVVLANDEDLPGSAGHLNSYGHWQIGNKVYTIVGVYPVETTLEEG